jgi:hypothetical protein
MTDPVITGTADVPAGDKHMDIAEFRAFGYLQEVNRQWLHPLGLALSVAVDADGTERLAAVWDDQDDPEGIRYVPSALDPDKVRRVAEQQARLASIRQARLGYVVQPVPGAVAVQPEQAAR